MNKREDDLAAYLLVLGKLALTVRILGDEQSRVAMTGILQADEMEIAHSIEWDIGRLMDTIDAQVALVAARTPKDWEDILREITDKITNGDKENGK